MMTGVGTGVVGSRVRVVAGVNVNLKVERVIESRSGDDGDADIVR